MKKIILLLTLFFINSNIFAQKSVIKINPVSLLFGSAKATYEGVLTRNKNKILYTNHARGEQSYLRYGGKEYNIPKNVKKPDIIYRKGKKVYLVEAEKIENLNAGIKQINSWESHKKTKEYYEKIFEGFDIGKYIILYSHKMFDTSVFNDSRYNKVKCVMDSKRNFYYN